MNSQIGSIGYEKIHFLGHKLGGNSISPKIELVHRIVDMPKTQKKKQVRSFLGAVNYYGKFMPDCAELMAQLSDLAKKQSANTVS